MLLYTVGLLLGLIARGGTVNRDLDTINSFISRYQS